MKKLNNGRFHYAKLQNCDNEFRAISFFCFYITPVCDVKTKSNGRCSKTIFALVWSMLFLVSSTAK